MNMRISDFKGITKRSIATVDSIENVFGDYYIAKLIPQEGLVWLPGEHGVFTIPGRKTEGKKWRAFSVASIPEEGFLMIGTRTGTRISGFKKQLIGLENGDELNLRGPFGWFLLRDDYSPLVMIAGGVGITPIRALLMELGKGNNREVEVVYSSGPGYLFEDEIKLIAEKDPRIKLNFMKGRDETREKIYEITKRFKSDAYYYVSGNPKMVKETKNLIKGEGIKGGRVINDPFYGY
ncbi:MAG TPA: FAD-dependent oxidoreductase [Clostridia bacterium]|nr:FAD-dependent oxidoreductase [Clostridia bacterium]